MPKPGIGESKDDFLSRCIEEVMNEGTPQEQAIAICESKWQEGSAFRNAVAKHIKEYEKNN